MQIVESVEQLAKCKLSGLHATSDIAIERSSSKEGGLTSTMASTAFEHCPVLHFCLFLLLCLICLSECGFRIFKSISLSRARHAKHLGLESRKNLFASILPKVDRSFVVSTGKYRPEAIPPDTIYWRRVSLQLSKQPL